LAPTGALQKKKKKKKKLGTKDHGRKPAWPYPHRFVAYRQNVGIAASAAVVIGDEVKKARRERVA